MPKRLTFKDALVKISFGGIVDGAPSWGSLGEIQGVARKVVCHHMTDKTDVSGLEEDKTKVPGQKEWSVSVTKVIRDDWESVDGSGAPLIGNYCKIQIYPDKIGVSYHEYIGFIADLTETINQGESQVEDLVIEGPTI